MPAVPDKLSIINSELALTGNNLVNVEEDGSDEWIVTSAAYDSAVGSVLEAHSWDFDTKIATLNRLGPSPDTEYDDAFAKPAGCLHLIWVRLNNFSVDYKIIGNQICLSSSGLPVTAKYVADDETQPWPQLFIDAIRCLVRAGIYRGLHEDPATADREEEKAALAIQQARTRVDQEQPKRALFNSRAAMSRRVRRPFVGSPQGWSGTGVPD